MLPNEGKKAENIEWYLSAKE